MKGEEEVLYPDRGLSSGTRIATARGVLVLVVVEFLIGFRYGILLGLLVSLNPTVPPEFTLLQAVYI